MTNVNPLELYTASDGDTINFNFIDGDFFFLRINSQTTKITINGNTLEWYNPVLDYTITISLSEIVYMSIIDRQCYLELISVYPFIINFYFQEISCPQNHLESNLTDTLTEDLDSVNILPPPKNWNDYNCDYQKWMQYKILAAQGTICYSDIPDEPKIEEYTETSGNNPCSPGNPPYWWRWKH